jgi:hypothetical protein
VQFVEANTSDLLEKISHFLLTLPPFGNILPLKLQVVIILPEIIDSDQYLHRSPSTNMSIVLSNKCDELGQAFLSSTISIQTASAFAAELFVSAVNPSIQLFFF